MYDDHRFTIKMYLISMAKKIIKLVLEVLIFRLYESTYNHFIVNDFMKLFSVGVKILFFTCAQCRFV